MKLIRYVFLMRVRAAVRTMTKVSADAMDVFQPYDIQKYGVCRGSFVNAGVDLPQPVREKTRHLIIRRSGKSALCS